MKKRIIALFGSLLVISTLLVGCSADVPELPEPLDAAAYANAPISLGSYSLYVATDPLEYLNFLDNFDESKYEIVDISTSVKQRYYGSDDFYIVTYKSIA